jgi:hypothetical protein
MLDLDDLGSDEKRPLGPRPGQGAVVHHCSGEADFDGLPGDELASREAVKRKLAEDATAPLAKQAP